MSLINLLTASLPHPLSYPAAELAKRLDLQAVYLGMPGPAGDETLLPGAVPLQTLLDMLPPDPPLDWPRLRERICDGGLTGVQDLPPGAPDDGWSWAAVPLALEAGLPALLLLVRRAPFDPNDLDERIDPLLRLLSAWIERHIYREITSHYRSSLEALHTIALKMSATLDLEAVFAMVSQTAAQIIPGSAVQIYLQPAEDEPQPTYIFSSGLGELGPGVSAATAAAPAEVVAEIARHRWPLVIEDLPTHPLGAPLAAAGWQVASLAGYQLARGGRRLGVLLVAFHRPRRLLSDERYLLSMLADQAVVAVDNAGTARRLSYRIEEVKALQRLTQKVNAAQDLETVFQNTVNVLHSLFKAGAVMIMMLEDDQWLHQAAAAGSLEDLPDPPELAPGQGIAGRVLLSGQTLVENDLQPAGRAHSLDLGQARPSRMRSLLAAPILFRKQVIGTVTLVSSEPGAFSSQSEQLLAIATAQAGAAFHNARLYQEENRRSEELLCLTEELNREIRTPLALLQAYVELLQGGELGRLTERQAQALHILGAQGTALARLADTLALIQARDNGWLLTAPLDLAEAARRALSARAAEAEQRGLQLTLDCPEALPLLPADEARIAQALDNLLEHAIKFVQGSRQVRLKIIQQPGWLQGKIITGVAEAPEAHSLSMVAARKIIEAHGGKYWIERSAEHGLCYCFSLPLTR
ncbi:MAG: GAF domain-containing protein [Chloroflexota bacterium]